MTQWAAAALLIIAGVWLVLATIVGGLPARLLAFTQGNG